MKDGFFVFTYTIVGWVTLVYLTFFDGFEYTFWNWVIAIPVNIFLASIWPIYWVLHWAGF